ncbi:MAG: 8-oxoguanine deaminase [bacterium]
MSHITIIKDLKAVYSTHDDSYSRGLTDIEIKGNRISRIGTGLSSPDAHIISAKNCVALPGLANTHHHFFQALTRAVPLMQNMPLFQWLTHHYPIWEGLTGEAVYWASLAVVGELLLTGCTLTTDHHYLFPRERSADLIGKEIRAAQTLGIRFVATRGSMSMGKSSGGLPPDSITQTEEQILSDSARLIETYHDPSRDSMQRIALAPCSPFSVSESLMLETAELARHHHVRLHTHLAETLDEQDYCLQRFGCRPVELMRKLGWLGEDVWFAHCVHLNDEEIRLFAETGSGVAHCPSSNMRLGSGIAPVAELIAAGAQVALAVDGSASNDSSDMLGELRQALLLQRVLKGPSAMSVKDTLTIASSNGYAMLGFPGEGLLSPGSLADIAIFAVDSIDYAGVHDPVAGLVMAGDRHRAKHVFVDGKLVVEDGRLCGMNETDITTSTQTVAEKLVQLAFEKTGKNYFACSK